MKTSRVFKIIHFQKRQIQSDENRKRGGPIFFQQLLIPARSAKTIKESGKAVGNTKGIIFMKYENGKAVYELKSGSYVFVAQR